MSFINSNNKKRKPNNLKKFFCYLLLLFSFFNVFYVIFKNKKTIFVSYDPKIYEKKYYQSQWVIPESKTPISDEELYAYAGYRYVKGTNPILVNPEAPPLGKYILGLSILFFNNYRIFAILFSIFVLGLIFLLGGCFGVFLTAINTVFLDQIIHSGQLDIYQLFFLLFFIFFYDLFLKTKRIIYLIFSGVMVGGFISIKVFFLYFFLFNFWLTIFHLLNRTKTKDFLFHFFVLNFIGLTIFFLTYFRYFLDGGSFKGFLGVQKWIYLFYSSSQIETRRLLGNYLSLILLNRWRFWSDGYPVIKYENWSIIWPIIFMIGMGVLVKFLFSKVALPKIRLLVSFVLIYNIFLFFVPVFPRYFLLLFIPLNILISLYFKENK